MSRKWVCDECAKAIGRPECVCTVKTNNPNSRKPDRCPWVPWEDSIITPVWTRVKKSKKEE